jgi:hypothetical protein
MELGWAIAAIAGGLLVGVMDFRGLFLLAGSLGAVGGTLTWGYQHAGWLLSRRQLRLLVPGSIVYRRRGTE